MKAGALIIAFLLLATQAMAATGDFCNKILTGVEFPPVAKATIETWLNKNANFSGPNCYHAALVSAGILSPKDIRYISPEEFEALIGRHFQKVETPSAGDIVVYEADSHRGHAAYLLSDNLVFHKKSFNKNYRYRILPLEEVGIIEADEWVPSPWDNFSPWTAIDIGKTPKAYYRPHSPSLHSSATNEDAALEKLTSHIRAQIVVDGPNWAVGKNMGLGLEQFLSSALKYVKSTSQDQLLIGRLISLHDQVFMSIEETYFSSRGMSDRRVEAIKDEICFPDNEFLDHLIRITANLFQKDHEHVLSLSKEKLKTIDRKRCNFDLFSFIQQLSL